MAYPHKRERILATVRGWLAEGKYRPGQRFPSDQELARRFKVTHVTVRGALKLLVDEGVLERRIGQGTIVRAPGATAEEAMAAAVGVAIPDNTFSFFGEFLKGVETALFPTRRPLLFAHTWELGEREEAAVAAWLAQGVRRLVLVPTVARPEFYRELVARGVRLVFADREVEGVPVPVIRSRDIEGARRLTEALVALGHRRIVHLAGPEGASTARARREGFLQALIESGLPTSGTVIPAGFFMEDGHTACKRLLPARPRPEAIFAANDSVAVGALRALAEAGLDVPGDVSVAGYGDTDLARNFQLTSVRQFPERMGTEAIRLILGEAPLTRSQSIELEPEVVIRGSTGARG